MLVKGGDGRNAAPALACFNREGSAASVFLVLLAFEPAKTIFEINLINWGKEKSS